MGSSGTGLQAKAYVCLDAATDESSVESNAENYDNVEQECGDILGENKTAAVICVMIADNTSFTLAPFFTNTDLPMPPTIQDLLETLNDVFTRRTQD